MALPVSIGDAILLSQLAYRLGHAFISGRKAAPAEFQEVQNQLYTLSNALEFVAAHKTSASQESHPYRSNRDIDQQNKTLERMISNCGNTLRYLEAVVNQYSVLKQNPNDRECNAGRTWRSGIKENWKKIRWTAEGGSLEKLKSTLAIHITGLNLAVSAINKCVTSLKNPSLHLTLINRSQLLQFSYQKGRRTSWSCS